MVPDHPSHKSCELCKTLSVYNVCVKCQTSQDDEMCKRGEWARTSKGVRVMGPGRPGTPQEADVESNGVELLAGAGKGLHEQQPGGASCMSRCQ